MALPDRWASWLVGAVPAGIRVTRQFRPDLIWSTYPIATAHLIGLTLHRITGIPWVADFRDSMTEDYYPRDVLTRRCYQWIERQAITSSVCLIFTTPSTLEMYLSRYPDLNRQRCRVIPNGYDEEDFDNLIVTERPDDFSDRPIRLLHAGFIYPDDRDPRPFFQAVSRLKEEGHVSTKNLRVDLRAAGSESYYSTLLRELAIDDIVHLLPALPHRQALQDCVDSDALLLLQAASCNHQIPAKAYEYLRLQKPVLALTDEKGDTAGLLGETGGATLINLTDEQALYLKLPAFLDSVRRHTHPLPDKKEIERYNRKNQCLELARCLSQLSRLETTR
jgi:glycosyltransferase involved in cell wall biosynthesis